MKQNKKKDFKMFGPGPGMGRGGPGRHLMNPKERAKAGKNTLYRLLKYIINQGLIIFFVLSFAFLSTVSGLVGPYLIGKSIDKYIIPGNMSGLFWTLVVLTAVYIIGSLSTWIQTYIMVSVSQKTIHNIRKDVFTKLQQLPVSFFDSRSTGELMSRVTNDVENINNTLTQSVMQFFQSIISVIGVVSIMCVLNIRLTLVTLITVPLVILIMKIIAQIARKKFSRQQKDMGELNGIIEESITGYRVIKSFSREKKALNEFGEKNDNYKNSSIQAQILAGFMGPIMNLINNLNLIIVAAAGGWFTIHGLATIGIIASFLNYSRQFSRPINQIAQLYNTIQSALAGAERIFELLDLDIKKEKEKAAILNFIKGKVDFNEVFFSYKKDVPVLEDISFRAESGKTIALVGPTGAGKTTIVNLMTRFYDIEKGAIAIDDVDIRNIKKTSLRSRIGLVLQDTYLFSGTIRENIRYGRLEATDDEVENASRLANAHFFIRHLPNGYETRLSEEGGNLSHGQRQLISIARVILSNPSILILDEATSNIDTRTEIHIQQAMLELMKGRTSLVIAHRLSTIRNADKILVIKNGKIVEKGTHSYLIKKRGFYFELYSKQYVD